MWIRETQTQRNDKHTIIMANIRPSNGIKQITTTTSRENQQKKASHANKNIQKSRTKLKTIQQ